MRIKKIIGTAGAAIIIASLSVEVCTAAKLSDAEKARREGQGSTFGGHISRMMTPEERRLEKQMKLQVKQQRKKSHMSEPVIINVKPHSGRR
jgi:hypothetical protein